MAVQPGEENVATLFGDVHYFYGPQTANPPHHRFDKDSYVYLFENAGTGRARIEIANKPGTDDQDAFDGFLDRAQIKYSYKRHCLVSVTVNDVPNQEEWHLPTFDPHNQNKYHYKLASLDLYFWTQKDALQFVNGVRRVLPPAQCEVLDEPAPPPRQYPAPSSLVQNLEKVALSDHSTTASTQNGIPSFAPPPTEPPPQPQSYAPVAYNPAAPAAPETIRAREKTPPPEDGGHNPLIHTLAADAQTPFSPGLAPSGLGPLSPGIPPPAFHSPPGAPSFAAPPVGTPGMAPMGFGQHPGLARAATMPAHAMPSPGLHNPYAASPFPGQGPPTPGVSGVHRAPPPVQHTPTPPAVGAGLPPPPPGGYSGYNYGAQAGAGGGDYSIHQQLYRPTEGEAGIRAAKHKPKEEPRGRLEENAGRLEKAATGMFKRLEKKFG